MLQWAGRLVRFIGLARLADRFGYAYLSPGALDPQQGEQPKQRPVKLLQSFGFRSSPKVLGSQGLVLAPRAGLSNGVAIAVDNFAVGPLDLKEGESVMFSAGGSTLKQDQAGKITCNAAAGQDVVVNGGTLKVVRVTDQVGSGFLSASVTPTMSGGKLITLVYVDSEGLSTPLLQMEFSMAGTLTNAIPPTASASVLGRVTGPGAAHFKA